MVLDHQWDLRPKVETLKRLQRCEETVERLAGEKADLYARLFATETARAEMEDQIGGLELAGELSAADPCR